MKKNFGSLILLFAIADLARAAAPADLGQGLTYLRAHSLADEAAVLAAALHAPSPLVLDLRYVTADRESAVALGAALASRATGVPLFILISPTTPPALVAVVSGELTLGPTGTQPSPKVSVRTAAAADRRAYDALESGLPLADLITGKIDKERYDEASLMKDFKNGNTATEPPPGLDPTKPGAPEKIPALTDRVLQRAVHLHRALLALRRPIAGKP